MRNWLRRLVGAHVHAYGPWALEEREYRLTSIVYGTTVSPEYFNVRVCECGHKQMQRIKVDAK
jgi:hypothetical protein